MSTDGFLSRWSRRKQEARNTEPLRSDPVPPQAEPGAPATTPETALPSAGVPVSASEQQSEADLIARLPSLDELTADMDLSVFLQEGVPEVLRKAALRRMWSLDPKIRDYVSEAREYAYDWNTPGGVPGLAPLPASEEIARMAARIVGGGEADGPCAGPNLSPDVVARSQGREQLSLPNPEEVATDPASPGDDPLASGNDALLSRAPGTPQTPAAPAFADVTPARAAEPAATSTDVESPAAAARPRRHGGAIPV
jgi:hypothetical protein